MDNETLLLIGTLEKTVIPIEDFEQWVKNATTRELVAWLKNPENGTVTTYAEQRIVWAEAKLRTDKAKRWSGGN